MRRRLVRVSLPPRGRGSIVQSPVPLPRSGYRCAPSGALFPLATEREPFKYRLHPPLHVLATSPCERHRSPLPAAACRDFFPGMAMWPRAQDPVGVMGASDLPPALRPRSKRGFSGTPCPDRASIFPGGGSLLPCPGQNLRSAPVTIPSRLGLVHRSPGEQVASDLRYPLGPASRYPECAAVCVHPAARTAVPRSGFLLAPRAGLPGLVTRMSRARHPVYALATNTDERRARHLRRCGPYMGIGVRVAENYRADTRARQAWLRKRKRRERARRRSLGPASERRRWKPRR